MLSMFIFSFFIYTFYTTKNVLILFYQYIPLNKLRISFSFNNMWEKNFFINNIRKKCAICFREKCLDINLNCKNNQLNKIDYKKNIKSVGR